MSITIDNCVGCKYERLKREETASLFTHALYTLKFYSPIVGTWRVGAGAAPP